MDRHSFLAPPPARLEVRLSRLFASRLRQTSVALALCGAIALAGCHPKEAAAPAPRPVVAVTVHPDSRPTLASLPGEIEARYSTPLSFRIAGKIVERRVRLGDTVKAGQIVAQLDPADAQKNVANAQAQLDAAQHRFVYAKAQLERDSKQAQENLIATAQLEATQDQFASALGQRDQAAQQLALANNQLQYTTLAATHAGVITAENADTGQNVSAGQAVYGLAWSGDIDVLCDAPESALAALTLGKRVTVTLPALPGKRFTARVREVSPAADPQSRTFRAKLTLEAPGPDVRLGMIADVAFDQQANANSEARLFTLPATALFHDGTDSAVWIVHPSGNAPGVGALELRRVQVTRYDERTMSVGSGLKDGEAVVVQGVHTVSAGEQVRVMAPLHPEDFAS